ncbi:MAG: hypothetical protein ACI94O_002401 [Octadecabacter sp.]|jgi:hypothetical protein
MNTETVTQNCYCEETLPFGDHLAAAPNVVQTAKKQFVQRVRGKLRDLNNHKEYLSETYINWLSILSDIVGFFLRWFRAAEKQWLFEPHEDAPIVSGAHVMLLRLRALQTQMKYSNERL